LSILFVAPPAFAETIFKCAGKNGTVLYRNFPCPSESESKVWVRTDAQVSKTPSAPSPGGNSLTPRDEPPVEIPTAPSPTGNPVAAQSESRVEIPTAPISTGDPLVTQGAPRIGMTTKEVKAILGEPTEVTQEEVVQGRVETWSYGASRSVQFDHSGRLSVMQP
jgi:hypothetical protein